MLADFQDSGLGSPPVWCNPSPDWSVGDAVMLMLSKFSGISVNSHEYQYSDLEFVNFYP